MTRLQTTCCDAQATRSLGGRLAGLLQPGDVVLLEGDLGAGKTTFTQGMAAALGVDVAVTSPTFTLMNVYRTSSGFDLVHVDVYRLERLSEVVDLGLGEILDDGAVVVVEWGDRAAAAIGGDRLVVSLAVGPGETARTVSFGADGPTWDPRLGDLEAKVLTST